MVRRRRSRPRRRLRKLVMLGGTVGGVSVLRTFMMARNEKRYPDLAAGPPADRPR